MFRRILVAFDGSDPARKAFDVALDMAQKYQSEVHVLAIARPPEFAEEVETKAVIENARKRLERQFGALKSRAMQIGMNPHFRIRVGHPAEQIVRDAEEHEIKLILLGHRGHGIFDRWLLGSISRWVITYADCPVMIVR
jgi:nucleotide-binding universal stress UspA family protein